jgi:hypothetical protein
MSTTLKKMKSRQVKQTALFEDDVRSLRSGSVAIQRISIPAGYEPDAQAVERLKATVREGAARREFDVTSDGVLVRDFELFAALGLSGAVEVRVRVRSEKKLAEGVESSIVRLAERLSHLDRCEELLRGQEDYEALFPHSRRGGYDRSAREGSVVGEGGKHKRRKCGYGESTFTEVAASRLNLRQRTLQNDLQIARRLDPTARERVRGMRLSRKKSDLSKLSALSASDQLAVLDKIDGDNLTLEGAIAALGLSEPVTPAEVTARRLRRTLGSVVNNAGLREHFLTPEVAAVLKEFDLHKGIITAALAAVIHHYQAGSGRDEVVALKEERRAA